MLNREEELRFCKARRAAIALDYQNLNPEQRRAALATEGWKERKINSIIAVIAFLVIA